MSYSDDDSNLLNNNAHNYSYPYTSNIEAYRTEVSLPPPHFVGYVPNNIPTDDDNQDDELNEEIYNFNIINNQNDENNNYLEELIDDKQEIFKNVETNKNGIGSTTREERTREKTKTIKNKKKRKSKTIKNKNRKRKCHSYDVEKLKDKEIKQFNICVKENINEFHQKDFLSLVNNKRKRQLNPRKNTDIVSVSKNDIDNKKIKSEINDRKLKPVDDFLLQRKKFGSRGIKRKVKSNRSNSIIIHKLDEGKNSLKIAQKLEDVSLKPNDGCLESRNVEGDIKKNIQQPDKNNDLNYPISSERNRKKLDPLKKGNE
jgi:hypothetical protein